MITTKTIIPSNSKLLPTALTFKEQILSVQNGNSNISLKLYDNQQYIGKLDYTLSAKNYAIKNLDLPKTLSFTQTATYKESLLEKLKDTYPTKKIEWNLIPEKKNQGEETIAITIIEEQTRSFDITDDATAQKMDELNRINQEIDRLDSLDITNSADAESIASKFHDLESHSFSLQKDLEGKSLTKTMTVSESEVTTHYMPKLTSKRNLSPRDRQKSKQRLESISGTKPKAASSLRKEPSPLLAYRQQAKSLIASTTAQAINNPILDMKIASSMLLQCHSTSSVQRAINEASPVTPYYSSDYARTITETAAQIPSVYKALKNQPKGMALTRENTTT